MKDPRLCDPHDWKDWPEPEPFVEADEDDLPTLDHPTGVEAFDTLAARWKNVIERRCPACKADPVVTEWDGDEPVEVETAHLPGCRFAGINWIDRRRHSK